LQIAFAATGKALPPPGIISPPKECSHHKDLWDKEGYFKSVCVINNQTNYPVAKSFCLNHSMRLFNVDEDVKVTSELKSFLNKVYETKSCEDCKAWIDGRDIFGCTTLKNKNGVFTKTKFPCAVKAFSLCEFWNLEHDETREA
jgi:hypothetical protein